MRLSAVYTLIWLTGASSLAAFELGWRPACVPLWDARARLYVLFDLAFCLLLAAIGLALAVPINRLPRLLRAVPAMLALNLTGFFTMGALQLSARADPMENLQELGIFVGIGVAAGLVSGVLAGLTKDEAPKTGGVSPSTHWALMALIALTLSAGVILLLSPRERDDGKFIGYLTLRNGDNALDLGVVEPPLADAKWGVVRIRMGTEANSLVMERREWDTLTRLIHEAESAAASDARVIGEATDTYPSDRGKAVVSVERAGVKIDLSSEHGQRAGFTVTREDISRFEAALQSIEPIISTD